MGRRATVIIPPPAPQKNDAASAEAGAEFDSIMKETTAPVKPTDDTSNQHPEDDSSKESVQPVEDKDGGATESFEASNEVSMNESSSQGEAESEADFDQLDFLEQPLPTEALAIEELAGLTALAEAPVASPVAPGRTEGPQLPSVVDARVPIAKAGGEGPPLTAQQLASMAATTEETEGALEQNSNQLRPTRLAQSVDGATAKLARMMAHADARDGAPQPRLENPGVNRPNAQSGSLTQQTGDLDAAMPEVASEPVEPSAERPSVKVGSGSRGLATPMGASAPMPGTSVDASMQPSSRIPTGPEAADMGSMEQDPLEGSVKLKGVRGARLAVPMGDGSVVRARLDLVDDALDIAIRASDEVGLRADQRVGELREALAERGIDLGEFDVSADADENEAAGEGDESAEAQSREDRSEGDDSSVPGDLQTELENLRADNGFGYYDETGPGALINRRL